MLTHGSREPLPWLIFDVRQKKDEDGSLDMGLMLVGGGIVGLTSKKPLTLFPNGSKNQRAVTVSKEAKTSFGIAAVFFGLGVIVVALRARREPNQTVQRTRFARR